MADQGEFKRVSESPYLIIQCYSCGQLLIAKSGQKSKLCTYCNAQLAVHGARILAGSPTASLASETVKRLKEESNTIPRRKQSWTGKNISSGR